MVSNKRRVRALCDEGQRYALYMQRERHLYRRTVYSVACLDTSYLDSAGISSLGVLLVIEGP